MGCLWFYIIDSKDQFSTPFSGPCGDYEGAARKAECADAQQAFYSVYIKDHGIKVDTIFLPFGLSTLFGLVSAQQADVGVLVMSNFNKFLVELQHGCFCTLADAEVYFCGFGDVLSTSAFKPISHTIVPQIQSRCRAQLATSKV
jgi:hypothetical protein